MAASPAAEIIEAANASFRIERFIAKPDSRSATDDLIVITSSSLRGGGIRWTSGLPQARENRSIAGRSKKTREMRRCGVRASDEANSERGRSDASYGEWDWSGRSCRAESDAL